MYCRRHEPSFETTISVLLVSAAHNSLRGSPCRSLEVFRLIFVELPRSSEHLPRAGNETNSNEEFSPFDDALLRKTSDSTGTSDDGGDAVGLPALFLHSVTRFCWQHACHFV